VSKEAEQALAEHLEVARSLGALLPQLDAVADVLVRAYSAGNRLYSFGNGGSSVDAQHLAEELVGRFARVRRPLPAQSLAVDAAAVTCIANDFAFEDVFARQVEAFVRPGDVVAGFTTSGRSENVVRGLAAARTAGATTVLFTGGDGSPARDHADHALLVPSASTARVQEMHVLLLHMLLERVDLWAAGEP
jgi:D-sedoheptulose 7-phosphate isomerase